MPQVGPALFLLCKSGNIRLELCLLWAKNGIGGGWRDLLLGKFSLAWGQQVSYTGAGTGSTVLSPVQQAGLVPKGYMQAAFWSASRLWTVSAKLRQRWEEKSSWTG